jgi:plasmid stabilization system protein ParE
LTIFSCTFDERNRSAARAVTERVEELASLLGEFPFIGHLTEADVRTLPVVRHPFVIFYTIDMRRASSSS